MTATDQMPVLSVSNLVTELKTISSQADLVRGVSFDLHPGEVLGIVGESGCGKSLTGFSMLGLLDDPLNLKSGSVKFRGTELVGRSEKALRPIRGNDIAMIFQDPMVALNPVLSIGEQMIEAITAHRKIDTRAAKDEAISALQRVGIPSPEKRLSSYPHEFSGGMRQRVVLAISFLNSPEVIIADEPTTALDVTVQSQILFEVQKMAAETGTAIIWITHDLALLSGFADRVAVMYAGEIVEIGTAKDVIENPSHPYTRALIGSLPIEGSDELNILHGFPPNLVDGFEGCGFAPRCPIAQDKCFKIVPETASKELGQARCHYPGKLEVTA